MASKAEIVSPSDHIREPGEGFLNEQSRYEASLALARKLPKEAGHLRHTIRWPVDMRDPRVHITGYFNKPNYSDPNQDPNEKHKGIDIQVPVGTSIVAPEDATVVIVDSRGPNEPRKMADIMLYSEKSGLVYRLIHLDIHSLPARLLERTWFDKWSDVKVQEGESLGVVGIFYNNFMRRREHLGLKRKIVVPDDVKKVYGKSYNHLHFDVQFQPDIYKVHFGMQDHINPLSVLKKLY
jgi:hypothetical protein